MLPRMRSALRPQGERCGFGADGMAVPLEIWIDTTRPARDESVNRYEFCHFGREHLQDTKHIRRGHLFLGSKSATEGYPGRWVDRNIYPFYIFLCCPAPTGPGSWAAYFTDDGAYTFALEDVTVRFALLWCFVSSTSLKGTSSHSFATPQNSRQEIKLDGTPEQDVLVERILTQFVQGQFTHEKWLLGLPDEAVEAFEKQKGTVSYGLEQNNYEFRRFGENLKWIQHGHLHLENPKVACPGRWIDRNIYPYYIFFCCSGYLGEGTWVAYFTYQSVHTKYMALWKVSTKGGDKESKDEEKTTSRHVPLIRRLSL
eukprot:scaffold1609_cov252-Pinguiococcus_pyrenoidosus.AAC.8